MTTTGGRRRTVWARGVMGAAWAVASAAACEHDDGLGPPSGPVAFMVANALLAPVIVSVDGAPAVILGSGRSSGLTVQPNLRSLSWTSAKPTDLTGKPIPDDIGEVRIPVPAADSTVEITNVVAGVPYFSAAVYNHTATAVSVGVADDDGTVACAGSLAAQFGGYRAYVQLGYFRLGPRTEVRAYRDPDACVGPYVAWPHAKLLALAPKTGLVVLTLDAAP